MTRPEEVVPTGRGLTRIRRDFNYRQLILEDDGDGGVVERMLMSRDGQGGQRLPSSPPRQSSTHVVIHQEPLSPRSSPPSSTGPLTPQPARSPDHKQVMVTPQLH